MTYRIEFVSSAEKEFKRLPRDIQERLLKVFKILEIDPYSEILKIRKIQGRDDLFRIRIGAYRLIYSMELSSKIVIIRIRHRKDVYHHL
ncbi:MAG: hypothetical protein A2Z91_08760 [Deltaproteobacteria bacterium GWA2_38_16]|nr:MAG: hypothetical protein A2Z91_08760 [Deltaproteobacteria bacterium GWA2_38_16]OGQ03885.1 MAG: hypothetical protein A3D19_07325 [Deltaproteobacteria bacterium RIFCSPHIGHO2_02_FULL_38_15]OGQ33351.1 MAG: hypothetical protein A3A72_08620 [Deltaproteobacteria bacterium RIFCSPLOWO2_01_FULL_38_9]OGQ59959.1 MAG: hypothetical protein A3G92_03225 [Deltaproteobacteria bacterium RIFCSPLOWO2_12_FULL_38_8]HBQ20931.1 type II toxin-antitoxin system mRNA interferase toxin, RelE/StbE family [Deltaproteobact